MLMLRDPASRRWFTRLTWLFASTFALACAQSEPLDADAFGGGNGTQVTIGTTSTTAGRGGGGAAGSSSTRSGSTGGASTPPSTPGPSTTSTPSSTPVGLVVPIVTCVPLPPPKASASSG